MGVVSSGGTRDAQSSARTLIGGPFQTNRLTHTLRRSEEVKMLWFCSIVYHLHNGLRYLMYPMGGGGGGGDGLVLPVVKCC